MVIKMGDWWDDDPAPSASTGGPSSPAAARGPDGSLGGYPDSDGFDDPTSFGEPASYPGGGYFGGDFDEITEDYTPTPATPLTMLYLALGAAGMGLLIGVVVNYLIGGRATSGTVAVAAIGWLLAGIVAVLGVARYQAQELRNAATSTFYSPNPSASLLRLAPLVVGALGVILTSYYIADWVARR